MLPALLGSSLDLGLQVKPLLGGPVGELSRILAASARLSAEGRVSVSTDIASASDRSLRQASGEVSVSTGIASASDRSLRQALSEVSVSTGIASASDRSLRQALSEVSVSTGIASASDRSLRQALSEVSDWPALLEYAIEAKLVLPLHGCVEALEGEAEVVPVEAAAALTTLGTQRSLRALQLSRQLKEVVGWFDEAGLPVLAYKGPTLALLAFGHLGSRESCDLDLLVRPSDYRAAARLLQERGFTFSYPPPTRCQLTQAYEVAMLHHTRGISVDLHRAFFSGAYRFGVDLAHHQRHSVNLLGRSVSTLGPEELLLLLGVHGAKHCWKELRWIYDLHGLLERQSFDWLEVLRKAREQGAIRALSSGLTLAHQLFGTPLPEAFEPDAQTRGLVTASLRYLNGHEVGLPAQHRYHWRMADTERQRWRYLVWTLFRPHELDLGYLDLPEWAWPFYYLVRPYRLLRQRFVRRRPDADSQ